MLKRTPKDFDVATNASPSEVRALFKNSRIIGRRFRVVHVHFGRDKIIEVATFRRKAEEDDTVLTPGGKERINENAFGNPEEDALRRDLTINGLFYDIGTFSVIDYVGGLADLSAGIIRTIGDPDERFVEDPVRIIRAIRHAARIGFRIEPRTLAAIGRHHKKIKDCAAARVLEEFLRELRGGHAFESFRLMLETSVLETLFPHMVDALGPLPAGEPEAGTMWHRLRVLDRLRAERGDPASDSILIAHLMAGLFDGLIDAASDPDRHRREAAQLFDELKERMVKLCTEIGIPRRTCASAMQHTVGLCRIRRSLSEGGIPGNLRSKAYFREAFALYELDAITRGESPVDPEHVTIRSRARKSAGGRGRSRHKGSKKKGGGKKRAAKKSED